MAAQISQGTGVQPTQEQIAERAPALWMQRGSPGGRDLEHWLEAEQQLREELSRRSRSGAATRSRDLDEAEKRLDGLAEPRPTPARRTPSGEGL
jgi:hypothetical protein